MIKLRSNGAQPEQPKALSWKWVWTLLKATKLCPKNTNDQRIVMVETARQQQSIVLTMKHFLLNQRFNTFWTFPWTFKNEHKEVIKKSQTMYLQLLCFLFFLLIFFCSLWFFRYFRPKVQNRPHLYKLSNLAEKRP